MNPPPLSIEKNLDAIEYIDDNKFILAASNLSGRYWDGSLSCFASVEDAPDVTKSIAGIVTECGISDICYVKEKLFVGLDSGGVEVYELVSGDWPCFNMLFQSVEHDDVVSSVSANCTKAKVVSSGYDGCIKIWDIEALLSIATYRPVHAGIIWQASCSTIDPDLILTCGEDGKILLLDLRLPKPAISLDLDPIRGIPTAISWKPQSETQFAFGDDWGSITIKDIRKPDSQLHSICHSRRIHRLEFSNTNSDWLASCSDNTEVIVMDLSNESPSVKYKDNSHDDFVRGLAWGKNDILVSCGWDKKVIKHVINKSEMEVANGPVTS